MTNRNNINIKNFNTSSIDYDDIKEDLKAFLKSQNAFSDYNFEGSGLSQIINLLAYNTHYNMLADNFAINESFIDTAVKKGSVISHANLLGYTVRSARCPVAEISITVVFEDEDAISDYGTTLVLNAGSPFSLTYDNSTYTFYTNQAYTGYKSGSLTFTFDHVKVYGGTPVTTRYTYNDDYRIIELSSENIDTTTLKVSIVGDERYTAMAVCDDMTMARGDDNVFFLRQSPQETYIISFGNGTIGRQLEIGTILEISYITSIGDVCNGCRNFSANFSFPRSRVQVVCNQAAIGGAWSEDIDDIRINAPRSYSAQNRCVTVRDYMAVISANYPNIRSINVWGGEIEEPPQYGKVFISIVKKDGRYVTTDEQEYILKNIINNRKTMTSIVEFVDPTYIGINVNSIVYYNSADTSNSAETIKTKVISSIKQFCEDNLGEFNDKLKYSRLVTAIDDADPAIINNNTSVLLTYDFMVMIGQSITYVAKFNNAIHKSSNPSSDVMSSGFYCADADLMCYMDDDPETNKIRLFYYNGNNEKVIIRNVGDIDYANGVITIKELNIASVPNIANTIRLVVTPEFNDVYSKYNQYAVLNNVIVSVIAE